MSLLASTTTATDHDLLNSIRRIEGISLNDCSSYTIVDCDLAVSDMIDNLVNLPVEPPSIYADLEGINLSRQGSISILQLYILPKDHTYLVDIHQLQQRAFSTSGRDLDMTLKTILENNNIPKVFFDVRNDSDALFHHFQINLSGVDDVQLMELATRSFAKQRVNGLQKCIEKNVTMTNAEKAAWDVAKEKGKKLFAPEKGGRYEVFNDRPLAQEIVQYCVQDVQFLPRLWAYYKKIMSASWAVKVRAATEERVSESQSASYNGHGKHKALAPIGWYSAKAARGQNRQWRSRYNDDY